MIELKFTGDVETVLREMMMLIGSGDPTTKTANMVKSIEGLKAQQAEKANRVVTTPETAQNAKEAPKKENFSQFGETIQLISDDEYKELKALAAKFLTSDPSHRQMLNDWLHEHDAKKLSEIPAALAPGFKQWIATAEVRKNA